MTPAARLERGYRRWLRCYPRSFRREHEAEMLDLLVASAHDDQLRPDRAECLMLVRGAAIAWLRPRIPAAQRAAWSAVRLMYLAAAADIVIALIVVGTADDMRSAIVARDAAYTDTQWHAEVTGALHPLLVRLVISAGVTLAIAWAAGRRRQWATVAFVVGFVCTAASVVLGAAHGSATYARTDLAAAGVLCLLQLAAIIMLARAGLATRPAR